MLKDDLVTVSNFICLHCDIPHVVEAYDRIRNEIGENSKTSTNKPMLQFPDTCVHCYFHHKCKNREGVDYAYNGLECANIWACYKAETIT